MTFVRIGLISPYSLTIPGGVQNQILALGRALSDAGHRVRVLGPCDGAPPSTGITPLGNSLPLAVNGSVAPIAPDPACALRTIRALRDEAFDVIHVHEPLVPGAGQTTLMLKTAPIVGTWHAAGEINAYLIPGLKWLASRVAVRTAVSHDAREMAIAAIGGDYEITFNGIELDRFRKAEPYWADAPTIAYVGRHEPRKGLPVLLSALQQLPPSVRLWVMSDGPETADLKRQYAHDDRIEWLGQVTDDEKIARIKGADVFCAPSLRGESFGVVLLEAMAARTPVVASDIVGYRNVARTGEEARLVPPHDPDALADALTVVLSSAEVREKLVLAGERRAEDFAMDRLAETYLEIYERAISLEAPSTLLSAKR
ncbi:MAG: phosphatidylinositol alpha-mannosyltransferase [Candidatus Poriferisodalaceae bacterium]